MDAPALILVVDDDPSLLQAMVRVLKTAGNRVLEASTGTEALRLAKEHRPDLMIVDMMLPDMDGLEVCRQVQADTGLAGVETILISSFRTSSEDQADGLAAGVSEYIARPMPNREFLARVEARLREIRARDALKAARDNAWETAEEKRRELDRSGEALRQAIVAREQEKQGRLDLEEELQAIFSHAPICLFLTDGDARIRQTNPAVVELFGGDIDSKIGQPCGVAFGCEHKADHLGGCGFGSHCTGCRLRSAVTDTFQTGRTHIQLETTINSRQEDRVVERIVSFSTTSVMVAGEKRVFVSMEDITERKRSEAALLKSQEKNRFLADMLQASSQPFAVGYADGRLILVNPAYCSLVGYSEEELRSVSWSKELTPPEWFDIESRAIAQLVADKEPVSYEKEYIRKDGRRIPVKLLTHIRPSQNREADIFFAFITDLTERKQQEKEARELNEQLFQAQKMESIGRLAGGVAHDYNNMLSVILGYTEMALKKTDATSSVHEDLKEIHEAGRRSAHITRQLLAFARKQAVAPQVLELNATVEGMIKMLKRLIGEDITLVWLPEKGLPTVRIDPSQVDQILANLCINARDAIPGVGEIIIETQKAVIDRAYCIKHQGAVSGEYVMLGVSDNGHGMEKEMMDKIFEPFFTTKEVGRGTGLGLATVYGIVKQNNGFINVYSEPGKGTTFKIYLPQHTGQIQGDAKEHEGRIARGAGETILVVEDETVLLKLTQRILEEAGYSVLTANTSAEAIRLAHDHAGQIRLLIVDVIMPEINGRELAVLLGDKQPGLKCLFMSGYTSMVIAAQGILEEGVSFIQKPFSARGLAVKVREVLES